MIEQTIELTLANQLEEILGDEVQVIPSWSQHENEFTQGQDCVLSIFVSPRQHDSFSLPTVNIDGAIAIDFRVEKYPMMNGVATVFQAVQDKLDEWHYKGQEFSEIFSQENIFYATELKLTGGAKVTFDRQNGVWTVGLNFQIRGTVFHNQTTQEEDK